MKKKKLVVLGITIVMSASVLVAFQGSSTAVDAENEIQGNIADYGRSTLGAALEETQSEAELPLTENLDEAELPLMDNLDEAELSSTENPDETSVKYMKYGTDKTIETVKYGADKENIPVIASVNNYVNIRSFPNEESDVVGKLYDKSVGNLLKNEGEWMYIHSGSVTGYVRAEYVLIGDEAENMAREVGVRLAKVITTTLKVRTEPNTDSAVLGLIPEGDILTVSEETDGFVRISIEEGEGYVSTEYVKLYTENVVAESKEEEEARLEKERQEKEAAEAAVRKALEEQKKQEAAKVKATARARAAETAAKAKAAEEKSQTTATTVNTEIQNTGKAESSAAKSEEISSTASESSNNAELGQQIVNYALQFIGNPYVYGGNSLTNGIDCSGFVMKVYQKFGISLPRTSGEQGASGRKVSGLDNAQPGDLIWYSGHIGIYMGNGQIIHASNAKEGIKVSQATYRTILGIRRIV